MKILILGIYLKSNGFHMLKEVHVLNMYKVFMKDNPDTWISAVVNNAAYIWSIKSDMYNVLKEYRASS